MKAGKKQGTTMTEFKVEAMHCGHCASAVTEALRRADPVARIDVDLAQKTVRVEVVPPAGRSRRGAEPGGLPAGLVSRAQRPRPARTSTLTDR